MLSWVPPQARSHQAIGIDIGFFVACPEGAKDIFAKSSDNRLGKPCDLYAII